MTDLNLSMKYLPDIKNLGGNARVHYHARARAFKADKEAWIACIREHLLPPMPKFQKAHAKVTLVFLQKRRRDTGDNMAVALKPLWDALVHWGIIPDDDSEHLTVGIKVQADKTVAPLTILEIEEEGYGEILVAAC